MRLRRVKVAVVAALATGAMALGVTAVPAQADHTCEHRISQTIQDIFGNKNNLVQLINDRFNTNFTVQNLNNLIERFCESR
jgi:hypothetical protein